MILNRSQASAVAQAMCALNNVCGNINATLPPVKGHSETHGDFVRVFDQDGKIKVVSVEGFETLADEVYADQNAFFAAYGLE